MDVLLCELISYERIELPFSSPFGDVKHLYCHPFKPRYWRQTEEGPPDAVLNVVGVMVGIKPSFVCKQGN
jgi:hypothetical protein